uniref:BTB domain-containing protein n=1 Tax=Panagrellus redivivus TaxID=6233 RepID=A0A7E4ZZE4_PANRE
MIEPNASAHLVAMDPSTFDVNAAANSSQTEIKVEYLKHIWTVKNFSHCYQEYLENFVTLPRGDDTLTWSIKIYPKGNGENNKEFVFLCLNRIIAQGAKLNKVGFRSRFFLKNHEDKEIEMRVHPNPSHSDYVSYIKRDVLFPQIQPNDMITVHVEIDVAVETITTSSGDALPLHLQAIANCEKTLSKNLMNLFEDERHTDFTIQCGDTRIPTHKAILAARSPVFAAMLDHESTEEFRTGIVKITDLEPHVVREMLKHIYSGVYTDDLEIAEDLLIAADKYRLEDLKQLCERTLMQAITYENACQLLILGDVYSAPHLRNSAVHFIKCHPSDCTKTIGWDAMVRDYPLLVTDVVRSFEKPIPSTISNDKGTPPSP